MILVKNALEFNESLNKLYKYPFEELSLQTKYLYIYLFYIFKYVFNNLYFGNLTHTA